MTKPGTAAGPRTGRGRFSRPCMGDVACDGGGPGGLAAGSAYGRPGILQGIAAPAHRHRHCPRGCATRRSTRCRLQLSVLAYNLGNLWRRLVLPTRIDTWSLTSLQQRLVKTGGRLVTHARYYWLLLTESHLTRRLFGSMLRRIWALPVPTG